MSKQELYKYVVQILKQLNIMFVDPCSNYAATVPGPFEDDEDAEANGVNVGQPYLLSTTNSYGIAVGNGGITKIRVE